MAEASSREIKLVNSVQVQSTQADVAVPNYKVETPEYYNVKSTTDISDASFEYLLGKNVPEKDRLPSALR